MSSQSTPISSQPIPPTPRGINPRAARRSWAEAPVRIWTILSIIVLLATIYFNATRAIDAISKRRLILHGATVIARVDSANGVKDIGRKYDRRDANRCDLTFTGPDGITRTIQQVLAPQTGSLTIGGTIELRVNPDNPADFTDQLEPAPWYSLFSVDVILVPLLILSLLMTLWRRRQVLSVWRRGEPMTAIVVDSKQSSIAPRSRVVRFALLDGDDRRVFHVLYPTRAGEPAKGDELPLIAPPNKPSRAIVAALYK